MSTSSEVKPVYETDWDDSLEDVAEESLGLVGADVSELPAAAPDIDVDVKPTGYHLLIYIPKRSSTTTSGIVRPEEYRLKEQVASVIAQVIEVGPEAFKDKDRFPTQQPWCKKDDFVLIHPYTGSRFQCRDKRDGQFYEYRILEDRHILAVVDHRMLESIDRINAA